MSYPHHLEADSVEEAVVLAQELATRGEYNIFRGQTQDWPMRSSYNRLDPERRDAAQERFLQFAGFVESTTELRAMHGDRFGVMAVAQHYGIPTVLVDFSTEPTVAGYFACDGDPPEDGRQSIIYLAHEEYIEQQYRDVMPQLRTIRVDVDNLWRLQAQAGLFLHLPFEDVPELDAWLEEGFGTIRFPYGRPPSGIPRSAIYPDRKSRLESLFDGYTSEEKQRRAAAGYEALGMSRVSVPRDESAPSAPAFVTGSAPSIHESWSEDRLRVWKHPAERFQRRDSPPRIRLEFDPLVLSSADPRELEGAPAQVIRQHLSEQENLRESVVDFSVGLAGTGRSLDPCVHPDSYLKRTVAQDLADCWDGMRRFPYPDDVLCNALAYLAASWARVHGAQEDIGSVLGDHLILELGLAAGGQHGLAAVAADELSAALRPDLEDLLEPESRAFIGDPDKLLHQVFDPRRLFDFDCFVALFGTRFVPAQFLLRRSDVIFFSPTRLERLGNR